MATMWWQRKGPTTSASAPTHFLRNQALHQQFFCYVTGHGFVRVVDNKISNFPSRSAHISESQILHHANTHFPQPLTWLMWTPSSNSVS